jgi:Arc/MetJ family transcription regulator
LLAGRKIDDSQPAVCQRKTRLKVETFAVGAAMRYRVGHFLDQALLKRLLAASIK